MRTCRVLHGMQCHSSLLSLDLRISLVFPPSLPHLEHLPRLAASCEKNTTGIGSGCEETKIEKY